MFGGWHWTMLLLCLVAIASVMGSWQGVFRAIQIARGKFLSSMVNLHAFSTVRILISYISISIRLASDRNSIDGVHEPLLSRTHLECRHLNRTGRRGRPVQLRSRTHQQAALIDTMVRIPLDLDGAIARSKDDSADVSASASVSQ